MQGGREGAQGVRFDPPPMLCNPYNSPWLSVSRVTSGRCGDRLEGVHCMGNTETAGSVYRSIMNPQTPGRVPYHRVQGSVAGRTCNRWLNIAYPLKSIQ